MFLNGNFRLPCPLLLKRYARHTEKCINLASTSSFMELMIDPHLSPEIRELLTWRNLLQQSLNLNFKSCLETFSS